MRVKAFREIWRLASPQRPSESPAAYGHQAQQLHIPSRAVEPWRRNHRRTVATKATITPTARWSWGAAALAEKPTTHGEMATHIPTIKLSHSCHSANAGRQLPDRRPRRR
jgi:hypothetical protein